MKYCITLYVYQSQFMLYYPVYISPSLQSPGLQIDSIWCLHIHIRLSATYPYTCASIFMYSCFQHILVHVGVYGIPNIQSPVFPVPWVSSKVLSVCKYMMHLVSSSPRLHMMFIPVLCTAISARFSSRSPWYLYLCSIGLTTGIFII